MHHRVRVEDCEGHTEDQGRWTAIVLAGTRPGGDPLAHSFGLASKSEVPILGTPMIEWVCRALLASEHVDRIVILTQEPDKLRALAGAPSLDQPRVSFEPSGSGIARSILAVAGTAIAPWPVLVTTSDHPLLTPAIIDDFLSQAGADDVVVGAVERSVVTAAVPEARRTWLRFRDGAYSGANLFALGSDRARGALQLWSKAEADRKQAYKLFLRFGPVLAAQALSHRLTFAEAIRRAGSRLELSARLVSLQHANAAIDVDKISDHRQAEAILAQAADAMDKAPRVAKQRIGVSVFDLDRTLTRRPTYTAALAYGAARLAPMRLALAPLVLLLMIAYLLKLTSRQRLKELEHRLLLGAAVSRGDIDRITADFALRLLRGGFYADGLKRLARDRADGRCIVLATAANRFYVDAIGRALDLGPDEIIATNSSWVDQSLTSRIDGGNCYGEIKRDMLSEYLDRRGLRRCDVDLRFFTDDISDKPTLDWSDEPIAVNPSPRLRKLAQARGWLILEWN